MEKLIRLSWFFEHPVEKVWEYLTNPELIARWLMENDLRPEAGCKFMFRTKGSMDMLFDGNVYCEVLEIIPFQSLVYSWKFGPGDGRIEVDSVVTWTLIPKDGGTELHLLHSGIDGERNSLAYQIMNTGWDKHVREQMGDLIRLTIHT